jgi:hypothetical protein
MTILLIAAERSQSELISQGAAMALFGVICSSIYWLYKRFIWGDKDDEEK